MGVVSPPEQARCHRLYVEAAALGVLGAEPFASVVAEANQVWLAALADHLVASGCTPADAGRAARLVEAAFMGFQLDEPLEPPPRSDRSIGDLADAVARLWGLAPRVGCRMREVEVVGVRVEMPSNQPIVLLREAEGERYLPIWIGAVEATAIAFAQQGVVPPRPLTHDLLRDILEATGNEVSEIRITEMRDNVFYALLVLDSGVEVSARPSDSIALALRTGSRIVCSEELLDDVGILVPDEQEDEVERFREFLDHVSPEDFDEGQALSPDGAQA